MKRKRQGTEPTSKTMNVAKLRNRPHILTPKYNEIRLKDLVSSGESEENTDDETYERMHSPKEKIEILLRQKPDLRKIKSNGRSTNGIHKKNRTERNFQQNMKILKKYLDLDTYYEYVREGIDLLPWPNVEPDNNLIIKSP
jgi:hypothetical protein